MQEMVKIRPIIFTLDDLGEARPQFLQTQNIRDTKTTKRKVNRGSVAFQAPETLVDDILLPSSTTDDLKHADIWSTIDDDHMFDAESIFQTPFRKQYAQR